MSRNATAQDTTSGEVSPVQGKQHTRFAKAFEELAQRIPQGKWSDWTSGVAKLTTNLSTQLELVDSWVRLKSYGKLSALADLSWIQLGHLGWAPSNTATKSSEEC